MTRQHRWIVTAAMCAALATTGLQARQEPAKPVPPRVQAKVDVVLAKYQGDKKTSSLPSTLFVTTNGGYTNLRLGVDVPVGTTTTTRTGDANRQGETTTRPSYRNIGTNIDCSVSGGLDGKFDVRVQLEDSSVFTTDADPRAAARPTDTSSFRLFTASNQIPMRDGQTTVFASVTDKITGEIVKMEVTFTIIK